MLDTGWRQLLGHYSRRIKWPRLWRCDLGSCTVPASAGPASDTLCAQEVAVEQEAILVPPSVFKSLAQPAISPGAICPAPSTQEAMKSMIPRLDVSSCSHGLRMQTVSGGGTAEPTLPALHRDIEDAIDASRRLLQAAWH